MRPQVVVQLPDAGLGLGPALLDCARRDLGGADHVRVEHVLLGGGREKLQDLAQAVELELVADPVSDPYRAARVAAQPQAALVRNLLAARRCRRA